MPLNVQTPNAPGPPFSVVPPLTSGNVANLETAAKSEMKDQIGTYTRFAQQADETGDKAAGALFREIANEEAHHYKLLKKAEEQHRAGSH